MSNSKGHNQPFLKAFLILLVAFLFSASADFKKGGSSNTKAQVDLSIELKQQKSAVMATLPKLPPQKVKWGFGVENDFLFGKFYSINNLFTDTFVKTCLKLLFMRHLGLRGKLKKQAFLTELFKENCIPLSFSA